MTDATDMGEMKLDEALFKKSLTNNIPEMMEAYKAGYNSGYRDGWGIAIKICVFIACIAAAAYKLAS